MTDVHLLVTGVRIHVLVPVARVPVYNRIEKMDVNKINWILARSKAALCTNAST